LDSRDGLVRLTVRNDGVIPPKFTGSDPGTGKGLANLTERTRALGGRLSAGTDGEGGLTLVAEIPLAPDPAGSGGARDGEAADTAEGPRHMADLLLPFRAQRSRHDAGLRPRPPCARLRRSRSPSGARGERRMSVLEDSVLEDLAGRTVLLTGVTGFIGQALLERLLSGYPDTRVVTVLRGRPGVTAEERLDELVAKPVFAPWRERVGEDEARAAVRNRVRVVAADITDSVPELPDDVDVVVHGASIVSFDPPIDEAFATNVVGTVNLYEAVRRAAERSGRSP